MKTFNKLVRDKIPEIIESEGRKVEFRTLTIDEYREELNKKLLEEVNEYIKDNNIEELADITEVIYGILYSMGKDPKDLEEVRKAKELKRGSFSKRIFLEKSE